MRFETKPHPFSCGMAWPARTMSLCIVPPAGERWVHRPMPAGPAPCRQASTPAREDVGVCVEGLCPWDWLAALGARRHAVGPRAGVVYARPPGGQSPKRSAGRAAERRTAARWEAPPGVGLACGDAGPPRPAPAAASAAPACRGARAYPQDASPVPLARPRAEERRHGASRRRGRAGCRSRGPAAQRSRARAPCPLRRPAPRPGTPHAAHGPAACGQPPLRAAPGPGVGREPASGTAGGKPGYAALPARARWRVFLSSGHRGHGVSGDA